MRVAVYIITVHQGLNQDGLLINPVGMTSDSKYDVKNFYSDL